MTWSQAWKLNLNAEKSEICTFSTWSNNSSWNPAIFIGNQKVCVNTTPGLLSVIVDPYYQSYSSYFLGLAPFHTEDGLSRFGLQ